MRKWNLPAYTRFDWLALYCQICIHGIWLAERRFPGFSGFKVENCSTFESSDAWKSPHCLPQCSSAILEAKWRHPIQSEWAEDLEDVLPLPVCTGRRVACTQTFIERRSHAHLLPVHRTPETKNYTLQSMEKMEKENLSFDPVWIEPRITHMMFVNLKEHFGSQKNKIVS